MHANVYLFWGQVEPRREPSQQQKDRAGERERAPIYSTVVQLQLRHECILNQRDSGGKVKWEQPCQQMFPRCDMESHIIRAHQQLFLDLDLSYKLLTQDIHEHMANV